MIFLTAIVCGSVYFDFVNAKNETRTKQKGAPVSDPFGDSFTAVVEAQFRCNCNLIKEPTMLKKFTLMACALAFSASPILADHHGGGGDGDGKMMPPPGLMIPLVGDFMPPPPEDGPEVFVGAALEFLDADGDEALSGEEIKAAMEAVKGAMGGEGEMPPPPPPGGGGGEMGPPPFPHIVIPVPGDFMPPAPEEGPEEFMKAAFAAIDSDGDGKLSRDEIKAAFESAMHHGGMDHDGPCGGGCGGEHGDHPMDPEWEMAECNGAEGNHVIRALTASEGHNAVAISLPEGRAAGCFEVTGGDYSADIIEETDPPSDPAPVVWSSGAGDAIADLVIGGSGIFHFQLTSDDGAAITVSYVDYPASE